MLKTFATGIDGKRLGCDAANATPATSVCVSRSPAWTAVIIFPMAAVLCLDLASEARLEALAGLSENACVRFSRTVTLNPQSWGWAR